MLSHSAACAGPTAVVHIGPQLLLTQAPLASRATNFQHRRPMPAHCQLSATTQSPALGLCQRIRLITLQQHHHVTFAISPLRSDSNLAAKRTAATASQPSHMLKLQLQFQQQAAAVVNNNSCLVSLRPVQPRHVAPPGLMSWTSFNLLTYQATLPGVP